MKRYLLLLTLVIAVKAVLMGWMIHLDWIGLGPDEAQYWTWSQRLDWGYYSKPSGIAWEIWLGTRLFGDTEFGVRFLGIVIAALLSYAVYALACLCRLRTETAFWAGVVMTLSPAGVIASLFATTDGGMVLFWTLACVVVARALACGEAPNYFLLGAVLLCGALFKWPIYLFWFFVFLAMAVYPFMRSRMVWIGIAVSLLGLLPSVVWNVSHDWVTFRHVLAAVKGGPAPNASSIVFHGNFFDFLGAQAALLSPVIFLFLLFAFGFLLKNPAHLWPQLLFCGGSSFLILFGFSLLALFQKIQGNWAVFAYPAAVVYVSWYLCEHVAWGKTWLKVSIGLSVVIVVAGLAAGPYFFSPFRHNLGWKELGMVLSEAGYDPDKDFLFGDKYQITSVLSFYGPGQKRAYFLNLHGARKNQFSYWPGMPEEQQGKNGYFVLAESAPHTAGMSAKAEEYRRMLSAYFDDVEVLGIHPLYRKEGKVVKEALIVKGIRYNGKQPAVTALY